MRLRKFSMMIIQVAVASVQIAHHIVQTVEIRVNKKTYLHNNLR